MQKRLILIFLLLLGLASPTISDLSMITSIDRSGDALINVKINTENLTGKYISIYFLGDLDNVVAKDGSGLIIGSTQVKEGNYTKLIVRVPTDYVELDLLSSDLSSKTGTEWSYLLQAKFSETVGNFSAKLSMPKNVKLTETNGVVGIENGELAISWSAQNINISQWVTMNADYTLEPEETDMMVAVYGALIVLIIVAYYFITKKMREEKQQPKEEKLEKLESNVLFKTLDENEKEIIREIVRQGKKTTQSHLHLYTHLPKATLSRRLASLENRGIILRTQKGNRKLVTLTDVLKDI